MPSYLATPDQSLALASDGTLVARTPDLEVSQPDETELSAALAAAFGRFMDADRSVSLASTEMTLMSSSASQAELIEKVRRIYETVPLFGEYFEFILAVTDLLGFDSDYDPLLAQVKTIDHLLHQYFARVDQQVFAAWSSTRLAMLADVQALASSARETMRSITDEGGDLSAPLTVARLAHADRDSLTAVNTFTSAVESGYWLRPFSGPAVGLPTWGSMTDERAPVYGDGTVWDPRLVLPTLLYALTVRMVVLKALHADSRRYCHEINQRVQFLLQVQMHWQTGIRRKLRLSTPELAFGAGFSVRPFSAGAVDVFTGNHDLIHVDVDALNLAHALGFYPGPLPPHIAPIPAALVARTITPNDIDLRFNDEYRAILSKQADVAFTRLRWSTGLHAFSDTIKALGEICAAPARDSIIGRYRRTLPRVRQASAGVRTAAFDNEARERVDLATALARLAQPENEQDSSRALADRYALFCELDDAGPLAEELRAIAAKYLARGRRWDPPSSTTVDTED